MCSRSQFIEGTVAAASYLLRARWRKPCGLFHFCVRSRYRCSRVQSPSQVTDVRPSRGEAKRTGENARCAANAPYTGRVGWTHVHPRHQHCDCARWLRSGSDRRRGKGTNGGSDNPAPRHVDIIRTNAYLRASGGRLCALRRRLGSRRQVRVSIFAAGALDSYADGSVTSDEEPYAIRCVTTARAGWPVVRSSRRRVRKERLRFWTARQ